MSGSPALRARLSTPLGRVRRFLLAAWRTTVFLLKVIPTLPSSLIDRVTSPTTVQKLHYPTRFGWVEGDLYRPARPGPHPGLVMCLGVIPIDVDHPQIPRLGDALARAGFAALLYWSPAMRDRRLDPLDVHDIASTFEHLINQPGIDEARSGMIGTCVGGSFVLMAAADERIRERIEFVGTFAPYSSMWTLAPDIASSTRVNGTVREPWPVDQLTRAVYVRTLTSALDPDEAGYLRGLEDDPPDPPGQDDPPELSDTGRLVGRLLGPLSAEDARESLARLPGSLQEHLTALSPIHYLNDIRARLIIVTHDRDDNVIPVGESRRLVAALPRDPRVHHIEFAMFQHADPTKRKLAPLRLIWELGKFYVAFYPLFRKSVERR